MPRKKTEQLFRLFRIIKISSVKVSKKLKHAEHVRKACKMHAFCCNDTLPVKTAKYILHTVCILLVSLILGISGSVCGEFGVRSGCVRGAFRVTSFGKRSRPSGSLNRCTHDVPGHFTGVFTISRVT